MQKYFYRVGNDNTGLWYSKEGQFTGKIHTDSFNWLKASALPMPFDNNLVNYLSVADSLQHLYKWFGKDEILRLQGIGYTVEEWVADDYKFHDLYAHNVINKNTSVLNTKIKLI